MIIKIIIFGIVGRHDIDAKVDVECMSNKLKRYCEEKSVISW